MRFLAISILTLTSVAVACAEPETATESSPHGISASNGIRLNGIRLNGIRLNGIRLNGIRLNGIRLNGIRLNGTALSGAELGAADAAGALMEARLDDGSTIDVRIDQIRTRRGSDIVDYYLSANVGGAWSPVCESDASGAPLPATLVAGVWNQDQGVPGGGEWSAGDGELSIGCANGAIYKCLDAGYKPWALGETNYPAHLQACIRMLRADYCGDGAPWTVNGRVLDVWDDLGIQVRTQRWPVEAEWGPHGARCLVRPRVVFPGETPSCVRTRVSTGPCGASFASGSLLTDAPESVLVAR